MEKGGDRLETFQYVGGDKTVKMTEAELDCKIQEARQEGFCQGIKAQRIDNSAALSKILDGISELLKG